MKCTDASASRRWCISCIYIPRADPPSKPASHRARFFREYPENEPAELQLGGGEDFFHIAGLEGERIAEALRPFLDEEDFQRLDGHDTGDMTQVTSIQNGLQVSI